MKMSYHCSKTSSTLIFTPAALFCTSALPCYEQPQKCVYRCLHRYYTFYDASKCVNIVGNFPWVYTKGHSVVSWLLLKQLNSREGKVNFLPPLVTACVTLVRTYGNSLSQTL